MMNYERNFFQLNMLKYLLLNESQQQAFENIPLIKGFEIIKVNKDLSTSTLNYDFCKDLISLDQLKPLDKNIHEIYLGYSDYKV